MLWASKLFDRSVILLHESFQVKVRLTVVLSIVFLWNHLLYFYKDWQCWLKVRHLSMVTPRDLTSDFYGTCLTSKKMFLVRIIFLLLLLVIGAWLFSLLKSIFHFVHHLATSSVGVLLGSNGRVISISCHNGLWDICGIEAIQWWRQFCILGKSVCKCL